MGEKGLYSTSPCTDLISTGNLLHFSERGVELANEVMFPPGVIIPHEALWHTGTRLLSLCWFGHIYSYNMYSIILKIFNESILFYYC